MKYATQNKHKQLAGGKRLAIYAFLLYCVSLIYPTYTSSETLEEVIVKCSMCHGADGNSMTETIPSISGMTEAYFVHTLDAYKNNGRQSEMMKMMVHTLTNEQVVALAGFYERQKFKPREQKYDVVKAKKGKQLHDKYCEKCHEDAGRITENNYGFLAGQWTPYLKQAIQDYLDKKRNAPPMMITKLKKLTSTHGDESIDLLMHYYASLQ